MPVLNDENRYKLLKLLHDNPDMNQRQIASALGLSLGKANFCLKALVEKGLVKVGNFSRSPNKKAYVYLLTLRGIEEKAAVTRDFLERKQKEYEDLKAEIEELQKEAKSLHE
ncbi:MAG: MarR family EPS-associated transcriptional regulator [Verrucomicrobia bacterium]|nr:MarR family EPS-associated transcriptional regulator [Verrucomicrobiota bacterium]